MKKLRMITAILLVLCFMISAIPAFAAAEKEPEQERTINSGVILDEDASGGYEGDYVVIYNPATSYSTSYSTGTMTGLIETSVGSKAPVERTSNDGLYKIDVDAQIAERERKEMGDAYGRIETEGGVRASYVVGSTKTFTISSYNPGSGSSLTFKVLAVGEHCYIWTPSQNVANYYTLDSINPDYAQQAADEFDRMYNLMNSSFGNHSNGSNGDGKVSLLFYNIDDGFDPQTSSGYVAGYFSSASYMYDGLPIINIDTYPGVYYVTASGVDRTSITRAYGTACHEYQHCINYSNTSSMSTWLNECFSAAAEEICYPGSSIVSRVQSWEQYYYSDNDDWLNPPTEFKYTSSLNLHNGYSMYTWSNSLEMDDTLALYAQVSFFAQYLYTQFGNTIYKQISNKFSSSETTAITNATGMNCADLVKNFRVATFANTTEDVLDGVYGFKPQADYDPSSYHDVANPYSLLGPVVFTGSSCSIKGGGAICVKPVNGVYNPPSGASSSLKYIGITLAQEPVALQSFDVVNTAGEPISSATMAQGKKAAVKIAAEPYNANNYTVTWSIADTNIASVTPSTNGKNATITGINVGSTTLTATVTTESKAVFTKTIDVTVTEAPQWKPTSIIVPGEEYLIGFVVNGETYLAVNYNENASNHYYNSISSSYYGYTAPAIMINGNVIGVSGNAEDLGYCTWKFSTTTGGQISSGYQEGYYLQVYNGTSYADLYPGTNSSFTWTYDAEAGTLYTLYTYTSANRYAQYYTDGTTDMMGVTGSVPTNGYVQLFSLNGDGDLTYYTVTFKDWDGTVLKTEEVVEGYPAHAPANPVRPGYRFLGWDVDFSSVTSDLIVTALYEKVELGSTAWVPTSTIVPGEDYLIGFVVDGTTYLMVNCNVNESGNNQYYNSISSTYYGYTAPAEMVGEYVFGVSGNAEDLMYCTWKFNQDTAGYTIQSGYQDNYYLITYSSTYYGDLHPATTNTQYYWQWNGADKTLYRTIDGTNRYAQYVNISGADYMKVGSSVPTNGYVQLFHEEEISEPATTYTVTFVDGVTGEVISAVEVEEGEAATAPEVPEHEGYEFIGWDVDFSNVTSDLTVTAQYQINSYTLTINYVDEQGNAVAAPYTATYNYGQSYSVNSPEVEGYTTTQTVVTGTMGAQNVTVTVVYTADPVEPGLIGDVDCDGDVDFDDVTLLNAYLLNAAEVSEQGLINANVNDDNKVSSADVVALNKLILGSN